jgi:hypothetical protein
MAGVSDKRLAPIGPFQVGIDNVSEQGDLQRSDDGKRTIALRDASVRVMVRAASWRGQ